MASAAIALPPLRDADHHRGGRLLDDYQNRATRAMPISHRRSVGAVLSVVSLVTGWSVKSGVSALKHGSSLDSSRTIWTSFLPRGPTANS